MESSTKHLNVNAEALNNGKQTKHSYTITILNKELGGITISYCQKNAGQAQGWKFCLRATSSTINTSNLPENIVHTIGENVFVETKTLTDKQLKELLTDHLFDQYVFEHENIIRAIEETILNGNVRRTALAKVVGKTEGISKTTFYQVLDALEGGFWRMTRGSHNSKVYSLL